MSIVDIFINHQDHPALPLNFIQPQFFVASIRSLLGRQPGKPGHLPGPVDSFSGAEGKPWEIR